MCSAANAIAGEDHFCDGDDIPLQVIEIVVQGVAIGEAHTLAGAVVDVDEGGVLGLAVNIKSLYHRP